METSYLKTLELDKIIARAAEGCVCQEAKEKMLELKPQCDPDEVRYALEQTDAINTLLIKNGSPRFGGVEGVSQLTTRAVKGGVLSMGELLMVAGALRNFQNLSSWYGSSDHDALPTDDLFYALAPQPGLEQQISSAILAPDAMADTASHTLNELRKKIRVTENSIRDRLESMVRNMDTSKYLQESVVSMRNGRYVVPVKSEYRGEVSGIIHDVSSTGATVFVEPQAVVEANARILQYRAQEAQEIERILVAFTAQVAAIEPQFQYSYKAMLEIDVLLAKARLALDLKAFKPAVRTDSSFSLIRARHPLIDPKKCVPVDIALGREYDSLIITGPNTGGKTVTLKTAGLLCAMAQCGFLIPADERSEICVFDEFLVDIGDEQSIEQSLSTFSGHMKKITGILELAMPHTLVLLDELGAGTDPAEGAALAVAIIEELRRRGVLLMATTHYAELKVFALETKGVINASCEFDLETLRPTYKLSVGVPGKSNAFLISEKLGIPERVIEAAQQHLSAEDKRLDAVLGQLDDLKLQLKESQNEVEELRNEATHQLDAARKKRDELIQQGENELEAARAKARALAQQVESKAYALTDELRQIQKDERMSTQQKAQRAREIAKKESEKLFVGTEVVHNPVKEFVPLKEVRVGQEVCIAELNQLATVLALPDKNGDVLVRAGIIKTKVPLKGLKQPEKLVREPQPKTKAQQRYSRLTGDANRPNGRVERVQRSAKMECNLLGLTVDEALPEVDSFIDRAILNGQTVVYLIHGNGTGALRTAIHKHLRGNRMVKSFRLGRYGEGESGVDLIGDDAHVVGPGQFRERFQLRARPHAADGVMRAAQKQQLHALPEAGFKVVEVHLPARVRLAQRVAVNRSSGVLNALGERAVHRRLNGDKIARLRERVDGQRETVDHACAGEHHFRRDGQPVALVHPAADGLLQRRVFHRIAENAFLRTGDERVGHLSGRGKVHIRHPQRGNVFAAVCFPQRVPFHAAGIFPVHAPIKQGEIFFFRHKETPPVLMTVS